MSLLGDFNRLELYGRSISAAGATLLFWRLLIPFKQRLNFGKTLLKLLLIALIVFPTVFMGQKKLIDHLVDSSSDDMRRSAEILTILKYGIAHGFVEIDGLSINDVTLKTAEGKMFVVLVGLLIYSSEEELKKIDEQLDVIAEYATTTQQMSKTQISYRNYQYATLKIIEKYRQYAQIVAEYDKQQKGAEQKSIAIYQQALTHAMNRWPSFAQKKIQLETLYSQKKPLLAQLVSKLNNKLQFCENTLCAKQNSQAIVASINQLLGAQSNWQHWCDVAVDQSSVYCQSDDNIIAYKLQKTTERYLVQQFGFEQFYSTKIDYLKSREFYDLFLLSLEKNHVPLISELELTQHELIIEEISLHISMYSQQQYQHQVSQLMDEEVRPRLTIGQFTLLPSMQKIFQKALGNIYFEALPITLTREQFSKQIVQPIYAKQYEYLSNKLASDSSWFKSGAPYEESGKDSLRSLVVPPISIAISLIFGVLNLISLLLNVVFLMIKENTIKRWLGFVFLLTALILTPRFNQYVISDQLAFEKLINHTQQEHGMAVEVAQWIIKIEPMIYSIGNMLRVNTLNGFEFD